MKLDPAREATTFVADEDGEIRQVKAVLNEKGEEMLDPVPMAPPVGYQKPFDMFQHIRDMVRSEHLRLAAIEAGEETFEEADDFDVGDDFDPRTEYEEVFDPVDEQVRMALRQKEFRAKVDVRLNEMTRKPESSENGTEPVDERGSADVGSEPGHPNPKSKGKSGKKQDAADVRSVPDADRGLGEVEE